MSGSLRRAGALFFLAASVTVLVPACAKDESSLFIDGVLASPSTTCSVKDDPTSDMKSSGILDTAFGVGDSSGNLIPFAYSAWVLVGNQLVHRGDPDRLRTETSRVEVYGADITVTDASGAILSRSSGGAAQFFVPTSGFVDPSSGTTPGFGGAKIQMIDPALARDLRKEIEKTGFEQQVVAEVVLHGRSLGGNELTTAPFPFPIRVCKGCLCDLGPCVNATGADMAAANCHVGIDDAVDCRLGLVGCPPCDPASDPTCPR